MKFRLVLFTALLCTLDCVRTASAQDSHQLLLQADNIRLANRTESKAILSEIDPSQLSLKDQALHKYLSIYQSSFEGNLEQTFNRYKLLLSSVEDLTIRIRILQSMLTVSSFIGRWSEGFRYADMLKRDLENNTNERAQIEAYKGLVSFYKNAALPEMALNYLRVVENLDSLSVDDKCYFSSFRNELEYSLESSNISEETFLKTRDLCKNANNRFYATLNLTYLLYHYMKTGRLNLAIQLMPKVKENVDELNAVYFKTFFYANVAKMYLLHGDDEQAEFFAMRAVTLDDKAEYLPANIIAYEVLVELAKQRGNYKQAVDYLEFLQRYRNQLNSQEIARQIGYQQARFESEQKQNKIDLLDSQNKLLTVESELISKEKEGFLLALFFAVFILVSLLIWSYLNRRSQIKLRELARTDSLTGLFNRGYFIERVKTLLESAKKNEITVTLLLLDLDYFKQVNDAFGHQTGDWALREIVGTIKKLAIQDTIIGRLGGEEFGIILNNATVDDGLKFAETCRKAICQVNTDPTGYQFSLRACFGVSDTKQVGYTLENLISASDLALFQSKQLGGNQVYEYNGKAHHTEPFAMNNWKA